MDANNSEKKYKLEKILLQKYEIVLTEPTILTEITPMRSRVEEGKFYLTWIKLLLPG